MEDASGCWLPHVWDKGILLVDTSSTTWNSNVSTPGSVALHKAHWASCAPWLLYFAAQPWWHQWYGQRKSWADHSCVRDFVGDSRSIEAPIVFSSALLVKIKWKADAFNRLVLGCAGNVTSNFFIFSMMAPFLESMTLGKKLNSVMKAQLCNQA